MLCGAGSNRHRWSEHVIHNKWPQVYFPLNLRDFHSIYICHFTIIRTLIHKHTHNCMSTVYLQYVRCWLLVGINWHIMHSSDIAQQRLIFSRSEWFRNVFLRCYSKINAPHAFIKPFFTVINTVTPRSNNSVCTTAISVSVFLRFSKVMYDFELRVSEEQKKALRISWTDHRWVS